MSQNNNQNDKKQPEKNDKIVEEKAKPVNVTGVDAVKEINYRRIFAEAGSAAVGGIVHSFIETPIVIPIEASITQTQINGKNFFNNFGTLFKTGNLYRSLPTALIGAAPKAVIHYTILVFYSNVLIPSGSMREATVKQSVSVGLATGASEVIFSTPINFCKFRMQRPEWGYKGLLDAIVTISKTEGVLAFWKGTLPTFCRNSICMAGMLGGYKVVEPVLPSGTPRRHLISGMIGGVLGSLASYPFEMWRAARMHNRNFYEEMWSRGAKRMLAGWAPGATRLVITSGIMGELLPRLKGWANNMKGSSPASDASKKPEEKKGGGH